jgi:MraZ protein
VFRGSSSVALDSKGRVAIPSRYRDYLASTCNNQLVLTLNPLDQSCLWLYPLPQWEVIDLRLQELSDFDKKYRRTKQMMRGYATDCELDGQGRILIPGTLREYAGLDKHVVFLGQSHKFELWDETAWNRERDEWLEQVGQETETSSNLLGSLSL